MSICKEWPPPPPPSHHHATPLRSGAVADHIPRNYARELGGTIRQIDGPVRGRGATADAGDVAITIIIIIALIMIFRGYQ